MVDNKRICSKFEKKNLYPAGFLKRTLVDASSMNRAEHSPAASVPYLLPN